MNVKQQFGAALASAVVMMLTAGLWHEVIMAHFYEAETGAKHEGTGLILVSYLILGGLMSYFYRPNRIKTGTILQGLWFGALMGVLWVFPHELAMAGAHSEPLGYVFKNGLWHVVEQGVGGVVISWIYSRGDQVTS
ncbi:MAG: hypothetical protein A2600_02875 [Candidatus Lambdaproteobacteria bacterium RIFOXYD1_FULL_56_27]|uniref:DUF1761 domain-containing protein n=1 Tax=Candidatus Lambdaproteobacteria bacterium RIFOXYD2_FULL_56_26 TaxID=1817773 RepID=A0A1F6H2V0_9PROT|nr:MAG: hypothetical protein A2557_06940 [Candidatus Lambdaproteobacteria bacterium RIFOXYD2_FULL_56_26]OGH05340.1 MAG: hypothetical protein A2426_05265 [Candidatus Lambdaproteobacteria bacterium RIFOXYC1_FULL_56_13]OGH09182.1 MAG: hypothetical protein A2600_02875 [Candidatus Lambdaproteobacteria bacterium RIFOXYD1_FULL_56_27]